MSGSSITVAELVETATGNRFVVRRARSPAASFGRRFTVIFDQSTAALAQSLSGTAARVMLALPIRLNFRAWRSLRQADLAADLGITQSAVSRALAELRRHGAVESQGRGTMIEWRLTRLVGYRGTPGQYHADERQAGHVSHDDAVSQQALKLGPMRVINGGRKSAPKPIISQDQPAPA